MNYLEFLEQRGLDITPYGKNVFIPCPFHGETQGSCSVSLKTGGFNCFGCNTSGSFAELIAELDGISIGDAQLLVDSEFSVESTLNVIVDILDGKSEQVVKRFITEESYKTKFPEITGKVYDYTIKRRIADSIDFYGLRMGVDGPWRDRLIIPLRDYEGRLIGFAGRSIRDNVFLKVRTYIAYDGAVNDTLFGIYENRKKIKELRKMVLTEGQIDAIFLSMHNIPSVARLGKNKLSPKQTDLIINCCDTLVLSYDGDKPGIDATDKEYENMKDYVTVLQVDLPKDKDPNNLTDCEVEKIYRRHKCLI